MAMLLPGISGSFILLIIGVYPTAINALTTLNLPLIVVIGAGVMVGFVVSSKGISFLLDRYKSMTFAAIIGLVIGSIVIVFPGIPTGGFSIISSIITFVLGFTIVTYFGRNKYFNPLGDKSVKGIFHAIHSKYKHLHCLL